MSKAAVTPPCQPAFMQPPYWADDIKSLNKLVRVLKTIEPDVRLHLETNDEGKPYVHLETPDGNIDYFIEPFGDAWAGKPRGRIGLPCITARTPGAVALGVATTFVTWLVGAASAASSMLDTMAAMGFAGAGAGMG